MHSLRGLLRAATAAALMAPSVALAHPGHGVDTAHSHGEWIVAAAVAVAVGGAAYVFKRNSGNGR